MKRTLYLLFFFLSISSSAQLTVRPDIDYVRTDVSYYQRNYYHRYYKIGYDSISSWKGNETLLNGSFTEMDSLANPNPYRYKYEYDVAGRKTGYKLWKICGNEKKFLIDESMAYYGNGLISWYKVLNRHDRMIHQDTANPSVQDHFVYTDFDSLRVKTRDYLDSIGNIISQYKYENEYAADRRIHSRSYSKLISGNWTLYYHELYRYSNLPSIPDTIFLNGFRNLIFKDGLGKDTCHLKQKQDTVGWTNFFRDTYSYDSLDRLIMHQTWDWSVSELKWIPARKNYSYEWVYTKTGQLAKYDAYFNDWDKGTFNAYTYFPNGQLKSYVYGAYDDIYNSWIYGHSYTYQNVEPKLNQSEFDFTIFPNPVNKIIRLQINLLSDAPIHCWIYNLHGKMMREELTEIGLGYFTFEISTENLAAGFYLLSISDGVEQKTKKFIVKE